MIAGPTGYQYDRARGTGRLAAPSCAMQISVERQTGAVVVRATGELDAFLADQLESAFDSAAGVGALVVDLDRVSFLDSTALGIVTRAIRTRDAWDTTTRVVLPRGHARRIFEITTLDRVLPVAPSRERALLELAGSGGENRAGPEVRTPDT